MEQEEKKEVSVLFFALFKGKFKTYTTITHFDEEKTAKDLYDWIEKEQKKIDENTVVMNCKIIR